MAVSKATLQENYRWLFGDRLLRLATQAATKLRPEVLVLLSKSSQAWLAAITKKAIAAQLRVGGEEEMLAYRISEASGQSLAYTYP